ncbi:MAG: hypothetical protein EBS99_16725, partial [Betaproteobacteria bacterium]|nr:hypothetical protein [Betaproteobacteria bacterium]
LPPVPLPRRMWAGGRLQWHAPLRVGDALERSTRIESVTHKSGRSGDLVFLLLRHEVRAGGVLALTEEQDIVYRAPAQASDPVPAPQAAPTDATWSREIVPDPVLLFRFSALTFNAHRIHYDRPYATGTEGYPGLVVHGPLIATLLADLARRERPEARVTGFSFRAVRPTTDLHPFRVCGLVRPAHQSAIKRLNSSPCSPRARSSCRRASPKSSGRPTTRAHRLNMPAPMTWAMIQRPSLQRNISDGA